MDSLPLDWSRPPVPVLAFVNTTGGSPEWNAKLASVVNTDLGINYAVTFVWHIALASVPPKRASDGVEGILRSNWIHQVLFDLPGCIAVLLQFDERPDRASWDVQEREMVSVIRTVRENALARAIPVIALLVSLESRAHSAVWKQRATNISTAADMQGRCYMIDASVDLRGELGRYASEVMLAKLAAGYYKDACSRYQKRCDALNDSQHVLRVRYSFKRAFMYELRQNQMGKALRCYEQAYADLTRMRYADVGEVKAMAELLSSRLCALYLSPLFGTKEKREKEDAAKLIGMAERQFAEHIRAFEGLAGVAPRAFEHYEWLARQYAVFADQLSRLDDALVRLACRSPGSYLHQAARLVRQRKHVAGQVLAARGLALRTSEAGAGASAYEPSSDGFLYTNQDWYGRPVLRSYTGHPLEAAASGEPSADELAAASCAREAQIVHARLAFELLERAYGQVKRRRNSSRMLLALSKDICDEYAALGDVASALSGYQRVLAGFAREAWWDVLVSILPSVVSCARAAPNVPVYVRSLLQLMAFGAKHASADSTAAANSFAYFTGQVPLLPPHALAVPAAPLASAVTLTVEPDLPLFRCAASFGESTVPVSSPVHFALDVRLAAPVQLVARRLVVAFTDPACDFAIDSVVLPPVPGAPDEPYRLKREIVPRVTGRLLVTSVTLEFAGASVYPAHVAVSWTPGVPSTGEAAAELPLPPSSASSVGGGGGGGGSKAAAASASSERGVHAGSSAAEQFVDVRLPEPQVDATLVASGPCLVGELFPIVCTLVAREAIPSGVVQFGTRQRETASSSGMSLSSAVLDRSLELFDAPDVAHTARTVPQLARGASHTLVVLLRPTGQAPSRTVVATVKYERHGFAAERQIELEVAIVSPFVCSIHVLADDLQTTRPMTSIPPHRATSLLVRVTSQVTVPLRVHGAVLTPTNAQDLDLAAQPTASIAAVLEHNDAYASVFVLTPLQTGAVEPGIFRLRWSRREAALAASDGPHEICTEFQLPALTVRHYTLSVTTRAPSFIALGSAFAYDIIISNRSGQVQSLMLNVADGVQKKFLFAGVRSAAVSILPLDSYRVTLTIMPLVAGPVQLPRIDLSPQRDVTIEPFDQAFVLVHPAGAL